MVWECVAEVLQFLVCGCCGDEEAVLVSGSLLVLRFKNVWLVDGGVGYGFMPD